MTIACNLSLIRSKIHAASRDGSADDVTLVAVSKNQPDSRVEQILAAGQRVFGENRVQEAEARWSGRRKKYPDLRLHLVGPLQTNKVKDAVALFDMIETVDREKLALALAQEMKKQNRNLPCLVQVNTGGEEQKSGIAPEALGGLLEFCDGCGLDIQGLMCIPPLDEDPVPHFAMLRELAQKYKLPHLSMGMSGDYEKAISEGATFVRVGTALFGEREV